ncbi:hypothetical protein GCM10009804_49600 [Kribbella hippodromi]|uniref:PH domain-containing protein n=1 Tax=Kribbella hippodromi TaxID=434347 RepID=A0ABN2DV24_9ACTN
MPDLGDQPPTSWTVQRDRAGQVVFPLRRRFILWQTAFQLFMFLPSMLLLVAGTEHADGYRFVLIAVYASVLGVSAWRFIAQRPRVIINHEGIRRGRKFLPWTDIRTIGPVTGPPWERSLPITPRTPTRKRLHLPRENIRNLPALHTWLEKSHPAHREPTTTLTEHS